MSKKAIGFLLAAITLIAVIIYSVQNPPTAEAQIVNYKSESCGCCTMWQDHLVENAYTVEGVNVERMDLKKDELGVPQNLRSCHTAVVEGYIVEGHVPAREIQRLLLEKPDARGLAVPGMPINSPGMEVEGAPDDPYDVIVFYEDGRQEVYASYR
jgi:hypothetical protein